MVVNKSATDLTRSQCRSGAGGSSAQPESPKYKGSGLSAGLSNMVQFPAGLPLNHVNNFCLL